MPAETGRINYNFYKVGMYLLNSGMAFLTFDRYLY